MCTHTHTHTHTHAHTHIHTHTHREYYIIVTDPTMAMSMVKGTLTNVLPMIVLGGWISWVFSGFIISKCLCIYVCVENWIKIDFPYLCLCNFNRYIPYSLKFLRTKIFVDFVVFEAPTKILSLKISYKLANPTCN